MAKWKKPVPTDRTVVDGIWSDILDDWSNSFVNDGDQSALGVNIKNSSKIIAEFFKVNFILVEQNQEIITQLKLLNLRIEEAYNTKLNERDIEG